ncbi:MAG: hypothetical protein WD423_15590 [Rhodothermales bacterium]
MLKRLAEIPDHFIAQETRGELDLYHRARMFVGVALYMTVLSPLYAALHR